MVHVLEHPHLDIFSEFDLEYKILCGDARARLKEIPDHSAQLVLTSPPYGTIKKYGTSDLEIGWNQDLDEYYNALKDVFRECLRILSPGCRLVINIGDEFVSTTKTKPYHVIPHSANALSMMLGEFRDDLIYNGTIHWQKVTTSNTSGGGKIMGSVYHPRNGHFFVNYEHIMVFKKLGPAPRPEPWRKEESRFTLDERREWFSDTWHIPPDRQDNHLAMFPLEIPERLIRMYSFVGETVLDPFIGSGTTLAAASKVARSAIGVELGFDHEQDWKDVIREKVEPYLPFDHGIQFV